MVNVRPMARAGKLSDFQQRKLRDYFHYLDLNESGTLDWDDFKRGAENIAEHLGWDPGHVSYNWLFSRRKALWEKLRKMMDKNSDGVISFQEVMVFFQGLVADIEEHGDVPRYAEGHVFTLLQALDIDGSGDLTSDELAAYYKAIGSEVDPEEVFAQLDLNGDGRITLEELEQLYVEWITADEPGAPGNLLVTGHLPE